MEKRLREISHFFVAPRREFAPAIRARPRDPFSINTSTSVLFVRKFGVFFDPPSPWPLCADVLYGSPLRLNEEYFREVT